MNLIARVDAAGADQSVDLWARAKAIVPILARNAAETDARRRIAAENIEAVDNAGLFRLMVPRRYGGLESTFRTRLEVTSELAKGCGSTAWVVSLMSSGDWIVGLLSDRMQEDVWGANRKARMAGSLSAFPQAQIVAKGVVVSGAWGWASGCHHADWVMVSIERAGAGMEAPERCIAFIPTRDLEIEETWFTVGMRGTGSDTIVAKDVFVPEHRILPMQQLMEGNYPTPYKDESLYRSSLVPAVSLGLVGAGLGLASRALDLVVAQASTRGVSHTIYGRQTEAPTVQLAVAKSAHAVDTAYLHARRAADDIDEAAQCGRTLGYLERARIRMDISHASKIACQAVRDLCSVHGASSFAESCPLQQTWRDIEVASRHAQLNPDISAEVYGRALFGITDLVSAFV